MIGIIVRILHKLGLVKGVWLKDSWGEIYCSVIKTDPWGIKKAYVYPFIRVGPVILKDDGTCCGETSYIKAWKQM